MESLYSKFTNLYPVSKTLKFELIPQGKTLENMKSNNVISSDEHRAESYTKVKGMIDEYHKAFIDNCLKNYEIKNDMLEKYYKIANDINKNSDEFLKLKGNMRKDISNVFTKKPEYKKLFGKETQ